MTSTEQRSQLSTTTRLATWAFVAGLVIAFIGVAIMSTDMVMTGAVIAGVGLVVALICLVLRATAKR